jgi:hypothetical protein
LTQSMRRAFRFSAPTTKLRFKSRSSLIATPLLWALAPHNSAAADRDWPTVGGDKGCSRYSSLSQINRRNVNQLQVAWLYQPCFRAAPICRMTTSAAKLARWPSPAGAREGLITNHQEGQAAEKPTVAWAA